MTRVIIAAVETAAQWMSIQIGFSVANVFNPQFGELMGPISVFYEMFTIALFFSLDLHLTLVEMIIKSFELPAKYSFTRQCDRVFLFTISFSIKTFSTCNTCSGFNEHRAWFSIKNYASGKCIFCRVPSSACNWSHYYVD
jgi:Flagellar biosynthesis pathway, component FliR